MPDFAVIDVETTGLSPAHRHRILEVAVVLVDERGRVVETWDTLVNPQRDVGVYEVHGLRAVDLYDAPHFEEVAGELASLLAGRVPVAHNWPFEAGFLTAEYERLGVRIPVDHQSGLCTMRLAPHYLPTSSRSLEACCECIRYPLRYAHEALEDAKAAAALLAHYLKQDEREFTRRWGTVIDRALSGRWPQLPTRSARRLPRSHHRREVPAHFLARLSAQAPKPVVADEIAPYVDALDRALLNREISRHEADELVTVAHVLGLSRDEALAIHRMYVQALCVRACADGVVTDEEWADLHKVGALLGVTPDEVESALREAAASSESNGHGSEWATRIGSFRLQPGERIVFTGEPPGMSRRELEARSERAGLKVTGSVSRSTRLVVAADTDSLSGKARRARELGVPIVDVTTFLRILESLEDA